MNYSIKVVSKNSQENITEINGSGKVAVHSADKIQILANNDSGILSLFGSKSQNTENLIAVKSGNNLEIILENGDVLTFVNFYNFKNATSIEFVDGDGKVHTLLSTDSSMIDMGNGSFLVHTQGEHSTLLSMSSDNSALHSTLENNYVADSSGGYGYAGLGLLALAGAGGGGSSSSSSSSVISAAQSDTVANLITLFGSTTNNTATVTITDADNTAIDATDLSAIGAATSGVVTVSNAVAISGTQSQVTAALVTGASKVIASTATVTLSDTAAAADINSIANATTGAVTATITTTADQAATAAVVDAITNVDANDVITLEIAAGQVESTDAIALSTKVDTLTVTDNGAVSITDGAGNAVAVAASVVDSLAAATDGAVTATLAVDTAISDATVTALSNVDAGDSITFAATAATADATALVALNTLADTKSYANLVTITEDAANIGASASVITAALGIKAGAAVTITDAISASDANIIANATTGVVTATVTAGTAAALNSTLVNAEATDALTLVLDSATASAADLNALNGKTSVNINAASITDVTSSTANAVNTMVTNIAEIGLDGNWNVTLSDATLSAAEVKTINVGTSGTIDMSAAATISSSTISDVLEIVNNNGATFATHTNYAVTLSDTSASAANIKSINDHNGTGTINMALVDTISSSSVSDVLEIVNDTGSVFTTATNYAVTLSDGASSAELALIDADTSGLITVATTFLGADSAYDLTTDLAANGATDLTNFTGLTKIDASGVGDAAMTITASDIFAANDVTGDIAFAVTGTNGAGDTLDLSTGAESWSTADGGATYTATGNFDGLAGNETYTITITDVTVTII